MISPATWTGPEEIRAGLDAHALTLIASGQEAEVLDEWSGHYMGTIRSYDPLRDEIEVAPRDEPGSIFIHLSRITFIKLLPSKKMTPVLAFVQTQAMTKPLRK